MEETTQVVVNVGSQRVHTAGETDQSPAGSRLCFRFLLLLQRRRSAHERLGKSARAEQIWTSDGSATLADKNLARDHTSITHTLPWCHPHRHLTGALPLHTNITVTDRYRNLERPGDPDRILIQAAAGDAGTSSDACLFGTVGVLGPCTRG